MSSKKGDIILADDEVVVKCEEFEESGGGGGGEEISCLICLSTDNTGGPQSWKQFWRPGEPLSLSRNLSTVFLLRNLLRVGSGQVAALLTTTFGVEPGAWVRLCGVCSETVRKAYGLHRESCKLQQEISAIGKHLRNEIGESWNVSDLGSVGKVEQDGDDGGWRTVINVHNIIRDVFQGCEWSNNWDHQLKTLEQQDSDSNGDDEDDHHDDGNDEVEEDGSDSADPLYAPPPPDQNSSDEETSFEQEEVLPPPSTTRMSPRRRRRKSSSTSTIPPKSAGFPLPKPEKRNKLAEKLNESEWMTIRRLPRQKGNAGRSKMIFECNHCRMVFGKRLQAASHIKKTHLMKPPPKRTRSSFLCPTCNHPYRCQPGKCYFQGGDDPASDPVQIVFVHVPTGEGGSLKRKRLHKCKACEQTFKDRDRAKSHVNMFHSKPLPFKCPLCGHPTACHEGRVRHMQLKHPKAKLKCDKCEPCFETDSASTYFKHDKEHKFKDSLEAVVPPDGDGKEEEGEELELLRCKFCAESGSWAKMVRHLKNKHLPELGIAGFPCSMCETVFLKTSELTRHMRVHNVNMAGGEQVAAAAARRRDFKCDICPSAFFTRDSLAIHHKRVHPGGRRAGRIRRIKAHKCGICGGEFTLRRLLRSHLEREHPEHLIFKCEECGGAGFESEASLLSHISESHHQEVMPKKPETDTSEPYFKCQKCDFSASGAAAKRVIGRHLQEHVITDHFEDLGDSTARCRLCSVVCSSSKGAFKNSLLFKHLRWSHPSAPGGQLFQCHICGRGYNVEESLRAHLHWHKVAKPRPRGQFPCQYNCGREFAHLYLRKRHYKRCHNSGASRQSSSLTSLSSPVHHQKDASTMLRTRTRPPLSATYSCDKCDFTTKVQAAFIHHIQNHSLTLHFQEVEMEAGGDDGGGKLKYLCKLCGIRCSRIKRYYHLNQMHAGVIGLQLHQCHICGKGFNRMSNMRTHLAWHGQQNNSPAEEGSSSSSEVVSQLESHRSKLHSFSDLKSLKPSSSRKKKQASSSSSPRKIKCRVCEVVLDVPPGHQSMTWLSAHMKETHGELYKFGCELCDQRFLESHLLQVHHEKAHFNERL